MLEEYCLNLNCKRERERRVHKVFIFSCSEFEGRDRLVKVSNSSKLRQLTIELGEWAV